MPIIAFGNSFSSHKSGNKIDTNLFVQKLDLRTNYIESNKKEDINLKNEYGIKNLSDPISIREACSKVYVDNIVEKDIDFNDVKLENKSLLKPTINLLLFNN